MVIENRLYWGNIIQLILIVLLLLMVSCKTYMLMAERFVSSDKKQIHKNMVFYMSFGYDLDIQEDDVTQVYSFKTTNVGSFFFEICLLVIYLCHLIRI